MSEQLQDKLVEILSAIQEGARAAGDFAMEQLPDIAQQYVLYGRVKSAVMTVAILAVAALFAGVSRYAWNNPWNHSKWSWDKDKKRDDFNTFVIWSSAGASLFFWVMAVTTFDYLVWLAPKVWLLKEIAGLIK